jgi:hypothetical protein
MAAARMKLLRNRRDAQLRKMRGDVAALLRDGRDDTARIRVRPPPRVSSPSSPQMPHRLLPASPPLSLALACVGRTGASVDSPPSSSSSSSCRARARDAANPAARSGRSRIFVR